MSIIGNFVGLSKLFRSNLPQDPVQRRLKRLEIAAVVQHKIRGGSFMEMFCLDFNQPLRVVAQCSEEELEALCADAQKFLVR